jgi:hypothetical protein
MDPRLSGSRKHRKGASAESDPLWPDLRKQSALPLTGPGVPEADLLPDYVRIQRNCGEVPPASDGRVWSTCFGFFPSCTRLT